LMAIVGVMGITTFLFEVVMNRLITAFDIEWIVAPIERSADGSIVSWEVISRWDMEAMRLSPEFIAGLEHVTAGRSYLVHIPLLDLPELALMSGLPSFVIDPAEVRATGAFAFSEGDWETAQPLMEAGCGLLLTPRMAHQHGVGLGDTLVLPGASGPVTCTVAGLGTSIFMGTSVVSKAAGPAFGLESDHAFFVIVQPLPGTEKTALRADLETFLQSHPGSSLIDVEPFFEDAAAMVDILQTMLNGMLLLAIVAVALGVVNTTMISVAERRRELGLLRIVGATRRQVTAVVTGEAALLGLLGGAVGLIAGLGLTLIFILVNGGNLYGFSDLPLWSSAWMSIAPATVTGLLGIAAAPLICAAAAWIPARTAVRAAPVEMVRSA
jgi:predicted lysophospholipase L1 biosynthesis ABC-type transport system permease subunit